eukprot:3601941-Amphidinium_carterae.2
MAQIRFHVRLYALAASRVFLPCLCLHELCNVTVGRRELACAQASPTLHRPPAISHKGDLWFQAQPMASQFALAKDRNKLAKRSSHPHAFSAVVLTGLV